jgi:hypothetical protein
VATSSAPVLLGGFVRDTVRVWDCIATDNADVALVIAHGMAAAPAIVILTPILVQGLVSQWNAVWDATNITLTKTNVGGSGVVGAQLRVFAIAQAALMAGIHATAGHAQGTL